MMIGISQRIMFSRSSWKTSLLFQTAAHMKCATVYSTRRSQSMFSKLDSMLQFSPDNPLYGATFALFDNIHTMTGLPWWLSISITTFGIRSVIHLPASIASFRNQAKLKLIEPELKQEMMKLRSDMAYLKWLHKYSPKETKKMKELTAKKVQKELFEKHNVHPLKSIVVTLSQLPVWILVTLTLRGMCGSFECVPIPEFTTEGGFWFKNLLERDKTYLLPLTLGVLNLTNMKLGTHLHSPSSFDPAAINVKKKMMRVSICMGLTMMIVSALMPSCINLYWVISAAFSTLQYLLFAVPAVRRAVGIPHIENEPNINNLMKKTTKKE